MFLGNKVQGNVAGDDASEGGGFYMSESHATLDGNSILNNTASSHSIGYGGGAYIVRGLPTLTNNIIAANRDGINAESGGLYMGVELYYYEPPRLM